MDRAFMLAALELARQAGAQGEIPVGAVIVRGGKIFAQAANIRERAHTALGHAEIGAIAAACEKKGDWRLDDCELYVTLEPCVMCAGAILNARIKTVIFGAYDFTAGAMGSALNVVPENSGVQIYSGICEEQCTAVLKEFFRKVR